MIKIDFLDLIESINEKNINGEKNPNSPPKVRWVFINPIGKNKSKPEIDP